MAIHEVPPAVDHDRLLEIDGTVQGVGFRPFIARVASRVGVRGWVRNNGRGVTVRVAGDAEAVDHFVAALQAEAPHAAQITALRLCPDVDSAEAPPAPPHGFTILASETAATGSTAAIAPDLALCPDCRRELGTTGDRRHGYPFITCTNCGPRYTIIEALPFDRARTTMSRFPLCPACAREYGDPGDRRFHAEATACSVCGPQVELRDRAGHGIATGAAAIAGAAEALRHGDIVAIKGVGGFHLFVDATNQTAVAALRQRKHREEKPLAVMFASLAAIRAVAEVTPDDEASLASAAAPIVLVRRRPESALADAIAPGNPWVGALLPYTPLHVLLLAEVRRPVVATSGNVSEEPLCTDGNEARERLGQIADLFLDHNRPIARPVDDSVVRHAGTGRIMLRRGRGFAPAPFALPAHAVGRDRLLCVGGHLKNTVAVTLGDKLVLSPHIGDLGNAISVAAFRRAVELLGELHGHRFARVVCDLHPDYVSTHFAESLGLPVVRVQHHLAHVLACMLEHGGGPSRVLGVAWDGTGFGTDGTIWGGEFIVVDRVALTARRVAHLRPFRLPGGETAIHEPRRSALGLCHEHTATDPARFDALANALGFSPAEAPTLRTMLERGLNAPITTSAGRLFDAAAALLGLRRRATFEAQAAMEVEFAADPIRESVAPWPMPIIDGQSGAPFQLDWAPLLAELLTTNCYNVDNRAAAAARLHATLAAGIAAVAQRVGIRPVALTGGCFQNARLLAATTAALQAGGFTVLPHRALPANDGALAAGQALGAAWGITEVPSSGSNGN